MNTEDTPKKRKESGPSSSTPAEAKPPPSATASKVLKGKGVDIPKVKGLGDEELDYDDDVDNETASDGSNQSQEPPKGGKSLDSEKPPAPHYSHR